MLRSPLSFVLAVSTVLASAAPTTASNVLTPQNFKDTVSRGVWFVEHFSPYCRHCRLFEPTWNDLIDHFDAIPDSGVHLAQVNCALNGDLCNDNGVNGYPQMNLYRDGEFVETYSADRDFGLLVEFLRKHAEPESTSVEEQEEKPASSSVDEEETPSPSPEPTPSPPPTPTSSPTAERLVVQTPRSDLNPSGTVVSLDVQTFDNYLAQGPAFIKFFAPWCGHCKKLAPTWTMLGRRLQHKLNVAEVDCEQHKALCASQGVTGFPMLFYYAHGVKTEYSGGRSYDQLVSFADKASNPTMKAIDASELDQVVRDNAVVFLLLHDESDRRVVNDVTKISQFLLGSPPVYVSTSPALFRKYDISSDMTPAILAFKDKDAREPVAAFYSSSSLSSSSSSSVLFSTEALKAWLHSNRFPSSFELSKDVFQQVMYAPNRPLVVVVATPRGQEATVSDKLNVIAQKWRLRERAWRVDLGDGERDRARDVVFTWMDAGQWGKWMKDMYGIKPAGTEPEVVVADHERLLYYNKDGSGHAIQLNSVSVASALEAIIGGTARPKHSRNAIERAVHSLNATLVRMQEAVVAHPYATILAVLGLVCAAIMALRGMFADTPEDLEAEKRYAKGGRLD